jgi:hypothetical protein
MIGNPTNRGSLISEDKSKAAQTLGERAAKRGRQVRAEHRNTIASLENYRTGFLRRDIPLDKSVAQRALREMLEDKVISARSLGNNILEYREAPRPLSRISWRIDESVYAELEESLCDL